jgi:16S rRNA (cytosine1402-N4)-methyltransferase
LAQAVRDATAARLNPEEETRKIIRRTFQALRIEVNGEFQALEQLLASLPACLKSGGRAALLCFHSGEGDRIEEAFREGLAAGIYASIAEEPIRPGAEEKRDNPRSSSARLWWAIRS